MRCGVVLARLALGLVLVNSSCARTPSSEPEQPSRAVETTSAYVVGRSQVMSRLATERCKREVACKRVGAGGAYSTNADCLAAAEHQTGDDLDRMGCGTLDARALERCASGIAATPCDQPLDETDNVPACARSSLCAAP